MSKPQPILPEAIACVDEIICTLHGLTKPCGIFNEPPREYACAQKWMNTHAERVTAELRVERDALRIWYDLGKLTVAIARGEAIPASAIEMNDNPVNCVSVLKRQHDNLKLENIRLQNAWDMLHSSYQDLKNKYENSDH